MAEETSNNTKVTIDKQEEDKNKDKEIKNDNPQEEKKIPVHKLRRVLNKLLN